MIHFRTLFFFLVLPFLSMAGIVPVPQGKIFTPISGSPTVTIGAPTALTQVLMPTPSTTQYVDRYKRGVVTFGVDHHYGLVFQNSRIEIKVKLQRFATIGSATAMPDTVLNMAISYSPNDSLSFEDRHSISFWGIEKYNMTLEEIKVNGTVVTILPANLYIHGDLFIDRIYDFVPYVQDAPVLSVNPLIEDIDCDDHDDQVKLYWTSVQGAQEYQLEWAYINNYGDNLTPKTPSELEIDFKHNSTRVSTSNTNYTISLAFDRGYVCYRVRAVGRSIVPSEMNKLIFGDWSTNQDVVTVDQIDHIEISTPFEVNKNWQYSSTYAEEGKKKEVISFFDGSLRNRQMVTKINSDNNTIVGETIYDHQGRPVVQVLPTPVKDPTCATPTAESSLKYYSKFTQNENGDAYSRLDFDLSTIVDPCSIVSNGMGTNSGASNYYSGVNTNLNGSQGYLPDAEKYPFSQVEYTPDNTGRVRRQSGVGEDFKLNSGHESKYFYSHPFQFQLDQLFGSEVGDAAHYQKNMVIDPNGQVSVSYLDQEGRVVATSLAGGAPSNLIALPSASTPQQMLVDLFAKNAQGVSQSNQLTIEQNATFFNQTISLSSQSDLEFDYSMAIDPFTDPCFANICFTCVYDLAIEVRNDCGQLLSDPTLSSKKAGRFQLNPITSEVEFYLDCPTGANFIQNEPLLIEDVPVGTYQVTKKLTVNEEALAFYLNAYLDSNLNTCLSTLYEMTTEYTDNTDFTDCEESTDCGACVAALGTLEEFITLGKGTQQDYELEIEACNAPCTPTSNCEVQKGFLLSDIRPGGQYAEYENLTGGIQPSNFPLSIFNSGNVLPISIGGSQPDATWKNPKLIIDGISINEYREDDLLTRSKIAVAVTFVGATTIISSTNPLIQTPVLNGNIFEDPSTGQYYSWPEQLVNVSDFIFAYQAKGSWANSLIVYHPEYSYYKTCLEYTTPIQVNDAFTSESFDQKIQTISTWNDAVTAGFIKPNWATFNNVNDRLTDFFTPTSTVWDPFGVYYTSNFGGATNELQETLLNYQSINGVNYSIMEFAAIITRCGSITIGVQPTATCGRFGDDVQVGNTALNTQTRDDEWMLFRGLYLSIKQQLQLKVARTRALTDANFYGYNGCIENTSFDPTRYDFLDFTPFGINSQYFNLNQPCHFATKDFYKYKVVRFGNPLDQYAQTANQIAYQNYLLTGECPSIQAVESTLNEIAITNQLNTVSFPFSDLASFSGLELTLNDFVAQSPLPVVVWNQVNSTSQVIEAVLNEGAGIYGTMRLKKLPLEPVVFTWNDVVGFHTMNYTITSGGESQFTIKAQVQTIGGVVTVDLNGATSIDLGTCHFEEECVASELGEDMELFLKSIAATGQLTANTPLLVQGATNPYDIYLTDKIQLAASNNLTSTMYWKYDQVLPGFNIYETSVNERLELKINAIEPATFNLNNLSAVASISELLVGHSNTFSLVCNDAAGNYLVTLKCDAIYHNGGTKTSVPFGACDLPTPLMCEGVEFENTQNIFSVLSDVLVNQSTPYNLMASANYTTDLTAQFPVNTTQIAGTVATSGTIETLTFDVPNGCPITLSLETTQNSAASFANLSQIQLINLIGQTNNFGSYNDFELQVNFELNGTTYGGLITGQTCLPLQACNGCLDSVGIIDYTPQQLDSISNKQLQDGIVFQDASVQNYAVYTAEITALNTRLNWVPNDSLFVQAVGYDYFFKNGISYPITTYIRFLQNFDTLIDNYSYLTDPLSYILDYGHATNVGKEYQRYLTAVDNFNTERISASLSATIPVLDTAFAMTKYVDTLNQYIAYLNTVQSDTTSAMRITEFPNVQTATIPDGACKVMYQQYVLAYEQFEQQQLISNTCLNYQVATPFVSYQVFVDNNLCCSVDGFAAFQNYVASFADTTSCPGSVPFKASCQTPVEPNLKDCQHNWVNYTSLIEQFNTSLWAQVNNEQLVLLYPNFNSFVQTGKCDCIKNYLTYLSKYVLADSSQVGSLLGPVQTIDQYCPTEELVAENSPCDNAYDNYLNCIGIYNQWAITSGAIVITRMVKIEEFYASDLCSCVDAYCSTLNSIMDGLSTSAGIPDLITICNALSKPPCAPNLPLITNIEMPTAVFIDPCTEFYTNTAQSNALNAFNQYMQNLTTEFSQRYIQHCMTPTENFTMKFSEIEHHFTLYYYDQAGNLIKTVPPEGVEKLNVADPILLSAISNDRANGTHNILTSHRLATTYQYNSLNQLVSQSMPDQDKMDIFEITLPNGLSSSLKTTSIQMISSNVGYLTGFVNNTDAPQGKRGYLYRTENGGTNWQRVNYTLAADLKAVKMATSLIGFAIGDAGVLLKTSDGGISWDLMDTYSGQIISPITAIDVVSSTLVRIASKNGDLIRITGANLNNINFNAITIPASMGTIVDVKSMYSLSNPNYLAVVTLQNGADTYDAILNLTAGSPPSIEPIRDGDFTALDFLNSTDILCAGQDGNIAFSTGVFPINYTQEMLTSSLMGTIEQIYGLSQNRSVALVNQNNVRQLYYTLDAGQTWLLAPGSISNPTVSLIQKTALKLELLLTDAVSVNRFIFNTTGSPLVIDQTSNAVSPGGFVATASLIDGTQTYYYGVGTDGNVYRSNPLVSSSAPVSFTQIANLPSFVTKKIDVKKLSSGAVYLGILSATGEMRKLVSSTITGTYALASVNQPIGVTNANYSDFTFADLAGTLYVLAYDKQNNKVGKVLVQTTATNQNFTAINLTLPVNNAPTAGEINAIAFKNNQLTVVGQNGGFYTTATISASSTTVALNLRKNMRSTALNEVKNSNGTLLVVGDNGRMLQRISLGAVTYWKTVPLSEIIDLNALAALTGKTIVAGDNATLFSLDLATLTKTPFTTNTGLTVQSAVNGVNLNAVETIQNQTYVVGENGTLLYSDNPLTTPFALASSLTNSNFVGLSLIPLQAGLQQRVIVVGTSAHVYRYKGVTGTETKEVFGPSYKDVHFANGQQGTFVGDHYAVRTTTNGGLSWTIELPILSSIVSNNLNSLNKVWTVPSANGNHFALIGGNNYCATVYGNTVTDIAYTQTIRDIQFTAVSPLNGFVATGSNLRKVALTPSANGYTVSFGTAYSTLTAVRAIHVFENQTVMLVGDNLINYFNGTILLNALLGQVGNFRDVYFHDNTEGYIVGEAGKFLQVNSTSNDPITHKIIVAGLQYSQKTLLDGVIAANNNVDIAAIAFGSRVKGVLGGDFVGNTYNAQAIPYVRLVNDESNEITARFFYDRLGRIVVSQNSRQFASPALVKYSYSLYDVLGRVYEAGEKSENVGATIRFKDILGTNVNGMFVSSVIDDADLATWLTTQSTTTRKEVTKSYYDASVSVIASQFPAGFVPDVLTQRKRIVHVTYEEIYDNNDATYDHATHYDYDIHGNVKTLLQDNKKISAISDVAQHRFKRLDYNFDLISGNVHRVDYQTGKADQWHHAYEYDADNRITDVYTSTTTPLLDPQLGQAAAQNEPITTPYWDKEANYAYYEHGPLARTELGAEKVQGLDYVYTLQGWIKGVNSNNLDPQNDPGKDGVGLGLNYNVAKDVFGYSLHYFDGDYKGVIPANESFVATQTSSDLTTNSSNLYNGNIGRMISTITNPNTREVLPLGNAYRYDQLQRLKEARSFTNLNGNTWGAGQAAKYYNAFDFDANGNITKQRREDDNANLIDDLTYGYNLVNLKAVQNRLYQVDDGQTNTSAYTDDIDDMPNITLGTTINTANNYSYDAEGRLIKDTQEQISLIEWRVDGKVKKINRPSGSSKKNVSFEYDAMGQRIAKHVMNAQNQLEKSTYYVLDAQGNTMSVYERVVNATNQSVTFEQTEKHMYGSSRLGVMNVKVPMLGSQNVSYSMMNKKHVIGQRTYELNNHLGNVLSVISDVVIPNSTNGVNVDNFSVGIRNVTDFSPFGVELKGRNFEVSGGGNYRFGFNGMEADNDLKGEGNSYTTEFRQYDPRFGRWLSMDPVVKSHLSPYNSMSNNPLSRIDPKGDDDYFNHKGKFIKSDNKTTSNIIIVDKKKVETQLKNVVFNKNNGFVVAAIARHYADEAGVSSQGLRNGCYSVVNTKDAIQEGQLVKEVTSLFNSGTTTGTDDMANYNPANKTISITLQSGKVFEQLNDANNFKSLIVHENDHRGDIIHSDEAHIDVYLTQVKHKSWKETTPEWKKGQISNIEYYFGLLAKEPLNNSWSGQQTKERNDFIKVKKNEFKKAGVKLKE